MHYDVHMRRKRLGKMGLSRRGDVANPFCTVRLRDTNVEVISCMFGIPQHRCLGTSARMEGIVPWGGCGGGAGMAWKGKVGTGFHLYNSRAQLQHNCTVA